MRKSRVIKVSESLRMGDRVELTEYRKPPIMRYFGKREETGIWISDSRLRRINQYTAHGDFFPYNSIALIKKLVLVR